MGQAEERDENDKPIIVDKRISEHFDFKIDGNVNGQEYNGSQKILVMLIFVTS